MIGADPSGISIRARFERLPTGLKGALILRGEDAFPHQVTFREVRVVAVDGAWEDGRAIVVPASVVDVAPRKDVFVPLECTVGDLAAGWYGFRCAVAVDGNDATLDGGRRFPVAWPRGTVRRGTIEVGADLVLGAASVRVERLECGGDATKVPFVASPPMTLDVVATADGAHVPVLEVETDAAGRGRITTYPLLRSHGALRLALSAEGATATLDVPLP